MAATQPSSEQSVGAVCRPHCSAVAVPAQSIPTPGIPRAAAPLAAMCQAPTEAITFATKSGEAPGEAPCSTAAL